MRVYGNAVVIDGGEIQLNNLIDGGEVSLNSLIDGGEIGVFYRVAPSGSYPGPYTVTPSEETQVLSTNTKVMAADVTINPIPSNYGRIVYNGSTITVY